MRKKISFQNNINYLETKKEIIRITSRCGHSPVKYTMFIIFFSVTIAHIRSPIAYLNSEQIFVALLTPVIVLVQLVLVVIFYTYMTRILVAALPAYRFGWFRKRIQPQLDFDNVEPRVEIPFPGNVSFPMERQRDSIFSNNGMVFILHFQASDHTDPHFLLNP